MTIQDRIDWALSKTEDLRKTHPEITNVRYEFKDIPFGELNAYALANNHKIDVRDSRAYILVCNLNDQYDTDIWIYSTIINYKPAEIIEL